MKASDFAADHSKQEDTQNTPAPYQYILLTDSQRQQIIRTVRPSRKKAFSYDNLNLVYGIKSEKSGFVMVLTYYLSDMIKRCDEPDDYRFILLFPNKAQEIDCQQKRGKEDLTLRSHISGNIQEEVKAALRFYRTDHSSWDFLKDVYGEEKSYSKYAEQNQKYIKELILDPEDAQTAREQKKAAQNTETGDKNDSGTTTQKQSSKQKNTKQKSTKQEKTEPHRNPDEYSKLLPKLRKKTISTIFGVIGLLMILAYFLMPGQDISRLFAGIVCVIFFLFGLFYL